MVLSVRGKKRVFPAKTDERAICCMFDTFRRNALSADPKLRNNAEAELKELSPLRPEPSFFVSAAEMLESNGRHSTDSMVSRSEKDLSSATAAELIKRSSVQSFAIGTIHCTLKKGISCKKWNGKDRIGMDDRILDVLENKIFPA